MGRLETVAMETGATESNQKQSWSVRVNQLDLLHEVGCATPTKKQPPSWWTAAMKILDKIWNLRRMGGEDVLRTVGYLSSQFDLVAGPGGDAWLSEWESPTTRELRWEASEELPVPALLRLIDKTTAGYALLHDGAESAHTVSAIFDNLTDLPLFLSQEEAGIDWRRLAEAAMVQCEDLGEVCHLSHTKLDRVHVIWRTASASSSGSVVLGKARKARREETDLWGGEERQSPLAILELSLPIWLSLTDEGRIHVLGHELLHLVWDVGADGTPKVKTRPHEIESFASELKVWGPSGPVQALGVMGAAAHPAMRQALEGELDERQTSLLDLLGAGE